VWAGVCVGARVWACDVLRACLIAPVQSESERAELRDVRTEHILALQRRQQRVTATSGRMWPVSRVWQSA